MCLQLRVLWISRCGMTSLEGASGFPALRELYAAFNDVGDLQVRGLHFKCCLWLTRCLCLLPLLPLSYLSPTSPTSPTSYLSYLSYLSYPLLVSPT